MATVQDLFDVAVERSNLNDAALIPTAEILRLTSSYEKRVFLTGARLNPDFFGKEGITAARGTSTDTWSLMTAPGNVAALSLIEISAITGTVTGLSVGDEVEVMSIRQPEVAIAPRVYVRNKIVHEYNSELQDDSSNYVSTLKVFYSFLPDTRSAMTDAVDLPEEFESLITLPLARTLAIRDQRPDEAAPLDDEFKFDWAIFTQQVIVFDEATVRGLRSVPA